MARGSKPGERRGGRKKGVPNKVTASAKEAIEAAFNAIGGTENLTTWARTNQDDFYKAVWVKILPKNVDVTTGGKPLTLEQRKARLAELLGLATS